MKRKNLIAWLVALALLLSGTALAAEKELVVYSEEDLARAKEYTDTLDTSGKTYDEHLNFINSDMYQPD